MTDCIVLSPQSTNHKQEVESRECEVLLPIFSRKQVAQRLGVGVRQLQKYLLIGLRYLDDFACYQDPDADDFKLNGLPIEKEEHIQLLEVIQALLNRYRYCQGLSSEEKVAQVLVEINQKRREQRRKTNETND